MDVQYLEDYDLEFYELENIGILLGIMITIFCFKRWVTKFEDASDEKEISPSDYTIMVKGIPKKLNRLPGATFKEKLTLFFEKKARKYKQLNKYVNKVNLVYDISNLVKLKNLEATMLAKEQAIVEA